MKSKKGIAMEKLVGYGLLLLLAMLFLFYLALRLGKIGKVP